MVDQKTLCEYTILAPFKFRRTSRRRTYYALVNANNIVPEVGHLMMIGPNGPYVLDQVKHQKDRVYEAPNAFTAVMELQRVVEIPCSQVSTGE